MPGSSMTLQNLLPAKAAESVKRTASARGSDGTFASVLDRRMQTVRPQQTPQRPEVKEREPAVQDRPAAEQAAGRTEAQDRTAEKNPAKEKLKELQKKVKEILEAMQDPEAAPEELVALAEELNGLMAAISVLAKAEPALFSADAAQGTETGGAQQPVQPISATPVQKGQARAHEAGTVPQPQEGTPTAAPQAKEQEPAALKAQMNPVLKALEKVLDTQAEEIEASPELKAALAEALAKLEAIGGRAAAPQEAAFEGKVEALLGKLTGTVVKTQGQPSDDSEAAVEAPAESQGAPEVKPVATAAPMTGQSEEETPQQDPRQPGYQAVKAEASSREDKSAEPVKAAAAPAASDKSAAAAPKAMTETTPVQNPQAFQDTLEAVEQGVQAKGQAQSRILEQVTEAVKTHFKADEFKSEMVMKLKPESLGNVSLKVSVEKGIVLAEFQVESQAVKQALESNLQDLRSALQDKGFNVFDLDVSVRKDNRQPQQEQRRGQRTAAVRGIAAAERLEERMQSLETLQRESTIDYLG